MMVISGKKAWSECCVWSLSIGYNQGSW